MPQNGCKLSKISKCNNVNYLQLRYSSVPLNYSFVSSDKSSFLCGAQYIISGSSRPLVYLLTPARHNIMIQLKAGHAMHPRHKQTKRSEKWEYVWASQMYTGFHCATQNKNFRKFYVLQDTLMYFWVLWGYFEVLLSTFGYFEVVLGTFWYFEWMKMDEIDKNGWKWMSVDESG